MACLHLACLAGGVCRVSLHNLPHTNDVTIVLPRRDACVIKILFFMLFDRISMYRKHGDSIG